MRTRKGFGNRRGEKSREKATVTKRVQVLSQNKGRRKQGNGKWRGRERERVLIEGGEAGELRVMENGGE